MRIRSFKTQLLVTIITGYVVLWTIFCGVVILNFREDTARLFHTQQEWLTLYTRTFLNDLKQGNSLAVEQKLKTLVNKKIFSEARLRYGTREILVQGSHSATTSPSSMLHWLLPDTKVVTPVRDDALSEWGVLEASLSPEFLLEPIRENMYAFIQQTGALFFFLLAGLLWMVDRQTAPLQTLSRYIRRFATRKNNSEAITSMLNEDVKLRFSELELLLGEFQATIKNLLALQEEIRRQRMQTEASKLAAQVAHDIRSPLSALSLATSDLQAVPEEKRILIRAAVNRINDIANELLERYRSLDTALPAGDDSRASETSLELLPTLVDSVISEKRSQYKGREGVSFDLNLSNTCYGMFAEVNTVQFTRIISNLINNAVDAIENEGQVQVYFGGDEHHLSICVEDTGKGVPADIIPRLFNRGTSHGKRSGMGLGLYHAKQWIEGWGGSVGMTSSPGVGTTVEIRLPRQSPPEWFLPRLPIHPNATIAILDDDVAIHLIWQQRLQPFTKSHRLTVLHFSHDKELFDWCALNKSCANARFLVDYELIGSGNTGIEVIKRLGIQKQAALVTSHYEDKRIRAAAREIGTPFIPKMMAPFVPFEIAEVKSKGGEKNRSTILLDDEELVHLTWKAAAKAHGKDLRVFRRVEDLFDCLDEQDPDSPIYIDRNLGSGILGEEVARDLYERGFKNLYLATGYEREDIPTLPWIKGVTGKMPPWMEPRA